jgi:hypothetical protein
VCVALRIRSQLSDCKNRLANLRSKQTTFSQYISILANLESRPLLVPGYDYLGQTNRTLSFHSKPIVKAIWYIVFSRADSIQWMPNRYRQRKLNSCCPVLSRVRSPAMRSIGGMTIDLHSYSNENDRRNIRREFMQRRLHTETATSRAPVSDAGSVSHQPFLHWWFLSDLHWKT